MRSLRPDRKFFVYVAIALLLLLGLLAFSQAAHIIDRRPGINPLESGFDNAANALYAAKWRQLQAESIRDVNFLGKLHARVSDGLNGAFWRSIEEATWETQTFHTLFHYIDSSTVVIDFGTWIGPTLLFSAQLAAKSFGIEADPAAIAEVTFNLKLNSDRTFYQHTYAFAGCVGTSQGRATMRSSKAGNSMSSFAKFYNESAAKNVISWTVNCWTLPQLFSLWSIDPTREHVFIKIDVESFECKLLPSLHLWLAGLERRPTLFFSMHAQIQACSDAEYKNILRISGLYRFRSANFDKPGALRTGDTFVLSDIRPPVVD